MLRTYAGRSFEIVRRCLVAALPLIVFPSWAAAQIQPVELEGFVVTGTPVPRLLGTQTTSVSILEGEELRSRGVTRVAEALSEVPGMVMVQNGSYGSVTSAFFRGAESDHLKVLVDGVEVNQAGGAFDFAGLLTADVERIEVARGPASALYGSDAMAGVVNIITRRGQGPPKATISSRAGSHGRREWTAGVRGGGSGRSYSLTASRMSSDGILELNNDFQTTNLSGAVFLTPDEKTRVGIVGRYGDRVYHFPTDGNGNVVDANAFTYGDELLLTVEADRALTNRIGVAATLRSYDLDGGSDDEPDDASDNTGFYGYTSLDVLRRTSGEVRANLTLPLSSVFTLGAEFEEMEQRSFSESLSEYGPSTSRSRNERSNRGYYAHLTGGEGAWSGNVGVRVEDNEQYGEFFTYQAGLSYALASTGTRLRGSVGKGMKEPTFFETISTAFSVGNPDLDPEQSSVWEVGAEQPLGEKGGQLTLSWFNQTLKDLIQYTFSPPVSGGPNYYNVAEARSRGLEVSASYPLGLVSISGAYTYLDTEVLDAGFDEGEGATFVEGQPLIRRPSHQLSVGLGYQTSRGRLSADLRRVGSRWDRDFGGWPAAPVELDGYTLLGMGADVTLLEAEGDGPGVALQIRGENLLDETYQEVFGFPAPGRAFLVGARLSFGG